MHSQQNLLKLLSIAQSFVPVYEEYFSADQKPRQAVADARLFLEGKIDNEELSERRRANMPNIAPSGDYMIITSKWREAQNCIRAGNGCYAIAYLISVSQSYDEDVISDYVKQWEKNFTNTATEIFN